MSSFEKQSFVILHNLYYHVVNETNEQGQTLHFKMLAEEFHERIANRTLVEKVPSAKPFVDMYEALVCKHAAEILTRPYSMYDTELVKKLLRK